MTFSITTLSIIDLLSIGDISISIKHRYDECAFSYRYADCRYAVFRYTDCRGAVQIMDKGLN
jgi:hypothetical protein